MCILFQKISKLIFLSLFFAISLPGCSTSEQKEKAIIFSCMICKGCVVNNIKYILENQLDINYTIYIDSTCAAYHNESLQSLVKKLKYTHMSAAEMERYYGVFGNFILLDSIGGRTEFTTDMHLRDYITK